MTLTGHKVLVTGGAGFIGSHLVELVIDRGCEVVVLDNFRNGRRANLAAVADSPALHVVHGDVTDATTCLRSCRGVDVVFHLACLGVRHSLHNPVENHQVNALGTLNMLEAAAAAGVARFIYVSSSEVYGRATDFPIRETTATWPLTVYGAGKLAGEHYTRAYHECFGVPSVCVRPFNNYGPRSHFEGDAGEVIPRFMLRALAGQPPVSFGEELRIDALARAVLSAAGRTDLKPVFEAPRPADVPRLWVDTTKLRAALDFKPRTTLNEGLARTLDHFKRLLAANPSCLEQMTTRNWER